MTAKEFSDKVLELFGVKIEACEPTLGQIHVSMYIETNGASGDVWIDFNALEEKNWEIEAFLQIESPQGDFSIKIAPQNINA